MTRWLPWILLGVLAYLASRPSAPKGSLDIAGTNAQVRPSSRPGSYPGPAPSPAPPPPVRSFATQFNMSIAQGKSPLGGKP